MAPPPKSKSRFFVPTPPPPTTTATTSPPPTTTTTTSPPSKTKATTTSTAKTTARPAPTTTTTKTKATATSADTLAATATSAPFVQKCNERPCDICTATSTTPVVPKNAADRTIRWKAQPSYPGYNKTPPPSILKSTGKREDDVDQDFPSISDDELSRRTSMTSLLSIKREGGSSETSTNNYSGQSESSQSESKSSNELAKTQSTDSAVESTQPTSNQEKDEESWDLLSEGEEPEEEEASTSELTESMREVKVQFDVDHSKTVTIPSDQEKPRAVNRKPFAFRSPTMSPQERRAYLNAKLSSLGGGWIRDGTAWKRIEPSTSPEKNN